MEKQIKVLVIKETASREKIWEAGDRNNWTWLGEIEQKEGTPYEICWSVSDDRIRVHYIEDYISDVCYFLIEDRSMDPKELEGVVNKITNCVAVYNCQELFEMLEKAQNPQERISILYRVGIAAPSEYDPDFYRAFENALANPTPTIRLAAIEAASYITWDEMKQLITTIHRTDPDEDVRDQAGTLLAAYQKFS
jgi:hypothetical protein